MPMNIYARRGLLFCVLSMAMSTALLGCPQPGFVGTQTCLSCHDGRIAQDKREFLETPHAIIGCEGCHGAGFAHVREGSGRVPLPVRGEAIETTCNRCHKRTAAEFAVSVHGSRDILECSTCHDPHTVELTRRPFNDNELCLQCHSRIEFPTEAAITAHTHHPYDPAGTGASNCVKCHMAPEQRFDQDDGRHNHTWEPVQPIESNEAGVTPAPPNSCAGITGCHDGTVPTAPVFNVDDPAVNERLQILYETWFGTEEEGE